MTQRTDEDPHVRWKSVNGDETYALQWGIDEDSTVWEIGGFQGRWAAQIMAKYNPYMRIFEPQKWGFGSLSALFFNDDKVEVRHYGLWVMNAALPLYHAGTDGASLVDPGVHSEVCQFRDVYDEIDSDVDLALMNIEGGEYALLPYMQANNLMKNFRYFWCQFHPNAVSDADGRFLRIYEGMKATHKLMWNFYPSAVAWERKG